MAEQETIETITIPPDVADDIELSTEEVPARLRDGFTIDTPETADWALAFLAQPDDELARLEAGYADAKAAILRQKENRRRWLEPLLRSYTEKVIAERRAAKPDSKRPPSKTIQLLRGKLSLRTVPGGARIEDPKKFIEWASAQDDKKISGLVTVEYPTEPIVKLDTNGAKALVEERYEAHLVKAAAFSNEQSLENLPMTQAAVLPPGAIIAPDVEKFEIEPAGPKKKKGGA